MDETRVLLNAILERLEIQSAKIDAMQMDIHHIKGDIAELKADLAVLKADVSMLKADVTDLKNGQERQDKILESLAVRSLEQETDIRELRRAK
jgi:cell division protein FtsB